MPSTVGSASTCPGTAPIARTSRWTSGAFDSALDTEAVIRSFDKDWTPPTGGGHRVAIAFQCESPAEVDAAYAELTGAGAVGHLPPWDAFWGMRYAVVHDPDGNPVDLFAYRD